MTNPFKDEMFLAARKWRHSQEWITAYYTIHAGHADRDAFAMAVFAKKILSENLLATAERQEP